MIKPRDDVMCPSHVHAGQLDEVSELRLRVNLQNFTASFNWEAPFTLNVTNTEPDVTYCVDVYNNSNGLHIQSECDLTETSYYFSTNNPSPCDSINVTVTPLNGAGNGTVSQPVLGYFFDGMCMIFLRFFRKRKMSK